MNLQPENEFMKKFFSVSPSLRGELFFVRRFTL